MPSGLKYKLRRISESNESLRYNMEPSSTNATKGSSDDHLSGSDTMGSGAQVTIKAEPGTVNLEQDQGRAPQMIAPRPVLSTRDRAVQTNTIRGNASPSTSPSISSSGKTFLLISK